MHILELEILFGLRKIVISNKQNKAYEYRKVEITPVKVKGVSKYQISSYTDKQVFHKNYDDDIEVMETKMKEMQEAGFDVSAQACKMMNFYETGILE